MEGAPRAQNTGERGIRKARRRRLKAKLLCGRRRRFSITFIGDITALRLERDERLRRRSGFLLLLIVTEGAHTSQAHLDGGSTPREALIGGTCRPMNSLLLVHYGENTENDRRERLQGDLHDARRRRLGNVLEVHGLSLDEAAQANDNIETLRCRQELGGHR